MAHNLPLAVLLVLSTFVGALIHTPLAKVLPESIGHAGGDSQHLIELICAAVAIAGVLFAARLFMGDQRLRENLVNSEQGRQLSAFWYEAWGFDRLYARLFINPYVALCNRLRLDPIDQSIAVLPRLARNSYALLSRSETGQLRWYATSIVGGAVLLIALVLL